MAGRPQIDGNEREVIFTPGRPDWEVLWRTVVFVIALPSSHSAFRGCWAWYGADGMVREQFALAGIAGAVTS